MFIGKYNRSIILTYAGVLCAVVGMFCAFNNNFKFAIGLLIIAGICDMFDGKVARGMKRSKEDIWFGIQLDSLADTIDFVVFPCVVGFCLGMQSWYHIIGYAFLCMAGVQRLSHFNVLVLNKKDDKPIKCYTGLPVTSTAISFPFLWVLFEVLNKYCGVGQDVYFIFYTIFVYLSAFLFIFKIKIPKFKGIAYPILSIIAVLAIIALIFFI